MPEPDHVTAPAPPIEGVCLAMFAFDIGFQIDLDAARARLVDAAPYRVLRGRRHAPTWFDYAPSPLRAMKESTPVEVGGEGGGGVGGVGSAGRCLSEAAVELVVYDFGATLVTFRFPFSSIDQMRTLGGALYDNQALEEAARAHVERTLAELGEAVDRPVLRDVVEDYTVFTVTHWPTNDRPEAIVERHAQAVAQAIEGECDEVLAQAEVQRTLEGRLSYTPSDLAIIDWNGAVLFDRDPHDVVMLLQHANVELLELRVLDEELDELLDSADEALAAAARERFWPTVARRPVLMKYASLQTDAAVLFEGVNNAIKLMGHQYLARLYRLAAGRLDLPSWQASVQRKLNAADSVYAKLSDAADTRRMEVLEIIIILLIMISIILPFIPGAGY